MPTQGAAGRQTTAARAAPAAAHEAGASAAERSRFSTQEPGTRGRRVQRACACGRPAPPGGECEECRRRRVQRRSDDMDDASAQTTAVEAVLASPGEALTPAVRGFMEARFAHDFSGVRVHAGPLAAASARALRAHAYAVGPHLVFGEGRYAPDTRVGQRLLAHELTHVVQQRSGLRDSVGQTAGSVADAAEAEALQNEARVHTSARLVAHARPPGLARRDPDVTVDAPAGPPGCTLDQHRKIAPAAGRAIEWLDRSLERLRALLANPAGPDAAATGEILQRYFMARDVANARRVVERLELIRHDIDAARVGTELTVECHTEADAQCQSANAYVSVERDRLMFCPVFFGWPLPLQARSIVHEMAHTIFGGTFAQTTDWAYAADRLLPHLTTEQALTNGESYALLVEELGTGRPVASTAPRDEVARQCRDIEPLIRLAIARGERWNRAAETNVREQAPPELIATHLGQDTPAIRQAAFEFYKQARSAFQRPLDIRCDGDCGARAARGEPAADHTGRGVGIGAGVGGAIGLIVGGIVGAATNMLGLGLLVGFLGGLGLGLIAGAIGGAVASHGPRIRVCPAWKNLPDDVSRIRWLLRAVYESTGRSVADSQRYAGLAGDIFAQFFAVPTLQQIDRGVLEARLAAVRHRLIRLRGEYQASSDAFVSALHEDRLRESGGRAARDLRRQLRSDRADRQLWGGSFAGARIRRAATATGSGRAVTVSARLQLTYLALGRRAAEERAAVDIPRIVEAIRSVWRVDIASGEYAGVSFRLEPTVVHLPAGTPRASDAFVIEVRGPDSGPSSGDAVHGLISLAPVHLDGARVIVVAHELAHLFGFTDTYLSEFRRTRGGGQTERMSVGRPDPANRADLLGMIDPVVLARKQRAGAVTTAQVTRQTGEVRVWEEEASIVLGTLGVTPPEPERPAPSSEHFDPDVELDRLRSAREAELVRIRARRARIDESVRSLSLAETIMRLEAEERALTARLAAPGAAPVP